MLFSLSRSMAIACFFVANKKITAKLKTLPVLIVLCLLLTRGK